MEAWSRFAVAGRRGRCGLASEVAYSQSQAGSGSAPAPFFSEKKGTEYFLFFS